MVDISQVKLKRYLFLQKLYEKSNGSQTFFVPTESITKELELEKGEEYRIVQYLEGEGWIRTIDDQASLISITHEGIKEIETPLPDINLTAQSLIPVIKVEDQLINANTEIGGSKMKKKLQIFISSTYKDLISERQAAVEAILKAGHIPAGMELFKAGKEQLETIYRWIDESDIYMLILGGRYGSIEENSGKSYTHLEYEYALKKGMPLFAVVISENALKNKVKSADDVEDVKEVVHHSKYVDFKKIVESKLRESFDDLKDIEVAVHKTISDLREQHSLTGWVSGKYLTNSVEVESVQNDNLRLLGEIGRKDRENQLLKKQLADLQSNRKNQASPTMENFFRILSDIAKKDFKKHNDYGLNMEEFGDIFQMMLNEGFLEGGSVLRGGQGNRVLSYFTEGSRITFRGMQWLDERAI